MCGLIFLYDALGDDHTLHARCSTALNRLAHRGPDEQGITLEAPFIMGHQRLSIIDLQSSQQPMCDASGRYVLAYNGEVYNYRELQGTLKDNWCFRTQGDTEVVLAGLVHHGKEFLSKMEGMWALSLWDKKENTLLLSRDRMGKKPLYYQTQCSGIACASELPAILSLVSQSPEEDLDSTADYLRYGFYLPGTTAYKDIQEVLPGHVVLWSPDKSPKSEPYWSLQYEPYTGTRKQAQKQLRETLIHAVDKRLVADVEVGAFLSGGVDSSLIVSILAKELNVKPKTFTIGFGDSQYDERRYASQIAIDCHTEHFEKSLVCFDSQQLQSLTLNHIGQPFADSSLLPTALVSKLAAQHVKVVLSGDGGDELFSGYQRYQARSILRWYTRLPVSLRKHAERALAFFPEPMSHHSRSMLKKAFLFQDITKRIENETPYVAPVMYSQQNFTALAPDLVDRGHSPPGIPVETSLDDIKTMMVMDALIYLPQDILTKVDRASMAYSIEARAPFLDSELVRLAFSFPRNWHRRGLSGKRILREAFDSILPSNIWERRKQGFAVPIHQWFRESLGSELESLLDMVRGPIRKSYVLKMLSEHRKGLRDHGYRLWSIYIYLLWIQHQFHHAY